MKKLIGIIAAMVIAGCGPLFDNCPGEQDCGSGCAPIGASCCPDGLHYCDAPYSCGSDMLCHGSGGSSGGTYYVSANGCSGGATISYRGSSYSVCNSYYQAAVAAHCTKILDNCR